MSRPVLILGALVVGLSAALVAMFVTQSSPETRIVTRNASAGVVDGQRSSGLKPAPIPTVLQGALDPRDLPLTAAIPVDANLVRADYVLQPPRQLIVTWDRAHLIRSGLATWQRRGVTVWQLDRERSASWHRVYTREVPLNNESGVEGYDIQIGDMSGDGRPEVMVVSDLGGSAGGAIYHVFANHGRRFRHILERSISADQGTMSFSDSALLVTTGVDFRAQTIHCCFRRAREMWLRWNGRRLVTVRETEHRNRQGWPPG